jgi:hypothetical protein
MMTKSDNIVSEHLNYMLGATEANLAHAQAGNDEIAVNHRITAALGAITIATRDADDVWSALNELGIPAAKKLATALDAIGEASAEIRRCQNDLVTLRFDAANQSTTNMMNAVLATVASISKDPA